MNRKLVTKQLSVLMSVDVTDKGKRRFRTSTAVMDKNPPAPDNQPKSVQRRAIPVSEAIAIEHRDPILCRQKRFVPHRIIESAISLHIKDYAKAAKMLTIYVIVRGGIHKLSSKGVIVVASHYEQQITADQLKLLD
ncbi:hypothetical protein CLF_111483 [Clonorchis sinensis]|uniref:Uncharacterized protein n=1 Tax=Clonorchis sinensis TaxID=79923 RepID=G7YUZ0_CLOSI|nr:hypothetical protein CLF_111483 [Clonorchis sinensis]